jgi:hypothetical protein
MTDYEKLRAAADLIEQVVAGLDRGSYICKECTSERFISWDDVQAARQLEAMVVKLRAWSTGKLFIGGRPAHAIR